MQILLSYDVLRMAEVLNSVFVDDLHGECLLRRLTVFVLRKVFTKRISSLLCLTLFTRTLAPGSEVDEAEVAFADVQPDVKVRDGGLYLFGLNCGFDDGRLSLWLLRDPLFFFDLVQYFLVRLALNHLDDSELLVFQLFDGTVVLPPF